MCSYGKSNIGLNTLKTTKPQPKKDKKDEKGAICGGKIG
jgi:hypothetical protein